MSYKMKKGQYNMNNTKEPEDDQTFDSSWATVVAITDY